MFLYSDCGHESPRRMTVTGRRWLADGPTVVLRPAVSSDDVHLRVVPLLFAVNSDEDILKHAGRVDICLRDVGHESRCPGLGAHHRSPQRPSR